MSFLKDYEIFTSGNETPQVFDYASALVALSSLASKKVWVPQGYFNCYPNLYVVLVGPPGVKKSSAMSVCKRLLYTVNQKTSLNPPTIPFSAQCQTKESLVQDIANMARHTKWKNTETGEDEVIHFAPMTICVTELSQFLGAASGHMVDFLTTIYGEDFYDRKTRNKGQDIVEGPFLTLLACTTPNWITTYFKQDVISGGFSRRALFVYSNDTSRRVAFPEINDAMRAAWERMVDYSLIVCKVKGAFLWDTGVKEWYENWYNKREITSDELLAGYQLTKPQQLLKIAMLVSLSESPDKTLKRNHFEFALAFLEMVEKELKNVLGGIGRNELSGIAQKVIRMLEAAPHKMLPEKKVKMILFSDADPGEIFKVLAHLRETNRIVACKDKTGQDPNVYIKLNE